MKPVKNLLATLHNLLLLEYCSVTVGLLPFAELNLSFRQNNTAANLCDSILRNLLKIKINLLLYC